ncbi:MAG: hypothetical protein HWN68_09585, partial [Desulfobacterales bacterium]|nr:hypothetical protein [Desulfobacterales bacterium]
QPDGGDFEAKRRGEPLGESDQREWQPCSGMATGYPVTVLGEEAAMPRQGTANAQGDEQEPSQAGLVGRAGNTRQSPLAILGQASILGTRVRKDACLPREICDAA